MILLDPRDRRPIYEQITGRFAELMVRGALKPGDPLPSVRSLAQDLSINPNTVQRAYLELERRGLIFSLKGKGSFVAGETEIRNAAKESLLKELDQLLQRAISAGVTEEELLEETRRRYKILKGESS